MADEAKTKIQHIDLASQYCLTRLQVLISEENLLVQEVNERARRLNAVRQEKATLLALFQAQPAAAVAAATPAATPTATPPVPESVPTAASVTAPASPGLVVTSTVEPPTAVPLPAPPPPAPAAD